MAYSRAARDVAFEDLAYEMFGAGSALPAKPSPCQGLWRAGHILRYWRKPDLLGRTAAEVAKAGARPTHALNVPMIILNVIDELRDLAKTDIVRPPAQPASASRAIAYVCRRRAGPRGAQGDIRRRGGAMHARNSAARASREGARARVRGAGRIVHRGNVGRTSVVPRWEAVITSLAGLIAGCAPARPRNRSGLVPCSVLAQVHGGL
jgi:hypothetical protein